MNIHSSVGRARSAIAVLMLATTSTAPIVLPVSAAPALQKPIVREGVIELLKVSQDIDDALSWFFWAVDATGAIRGGEPPPAAPTEFPASKLEDTLKALADELTRLRRASESAQEAIRAADELRAAVQFGCNGKPYASCPDEGAKRRFDEAVFKATEEIARLRAEWQDQLTRSREIVDERLALQERIASVVDRVALEQRTLVDSRFALQADREELQRRSRTLAADIAVYEAQRTGHAADLALVTRAEAEVDRPTP